MASLTGHCLCGSVAFEVARGAVTITQGSDMGKAWDLIAAIRIGVLDPGHDVRPRAHVRTATAAAWEPMPDDGLPRLDGPP